MIGALGSDDVDNGTTILRSPVFDISSLGKPAIQFQQWFVNFGGWSDANDSLVVSISNPSQNNVEILDISVAQFENEWQIKNYTNLNEFDLGDSLILEIAVSDYQPDNHWVEAAIDGFILYQDTSSVTSISNIVNDINFIVFPNPVKNTLNTNVYGQKRIVNILGKEVLSSKQKTIDVSSLSSGVYFIIYQNKRIKFIKN